MMMHKTTLFDSKKRLVRIISGSLLVLVLGFVTINVWPMIHGVRLKLAGLENGKLYTEGILSLSGSAEHAIKLTINGRELPVTRNGSFEDVLVLLPGYNIITVRALDKFGNVSERKYEVVQRSAKVADGDPVINNS